jgi:lysophospholipase L1-like esterase
MLGLLFIAVLLPFATPVHEMPARVAAPISRLDDPVWKARHEAKLREVRSKRVDVLLLGDSITANYEVTGPDPLHDYRGVWERYYTGRHVLNLGFSGDGTLNLLWRIMNGEIDDLAPKVAAILIGTNDIGWLSRTAADTVEGIDSVVSELHRRLPTTTILLVGILPSDRGPLVRQATNEINAALADRYRDGAVPYVVYRDISSAFVTNGILDTSLFADPQQSPPEPALHPAPIGQARMAAALEPTLSRLLRDACRC